MKTELPEFKRCCCCIPLRYGLLTFGYIKMIASIPVIILLIVMINWSLTIYSKYEFFSIWDVLIPVFTLIFILLDVILTIVFLIGGHQKSVKLLRIYYIYNIVMLVIGAAIMIFVCVMQSSMYVHFGSQEKHGFVFSTTAVFSEVLATVTNIGFELYFILLVRSEIKKLSNSYNFRFNNLSAYECSIENANIPQDNQEQMN